MCQSNMQAPLGIRLGKPQCNFNLDAMLQVIPVVALRHAFSQRKGPALLPGLSEVPPRATRR